MSDYNGRTIYMGIDVHKNSYSIAVMCDKTVVKRDKLIADPSVLLNYCRKFKGSFIKSAYEAGFCGFSLHRILISNGIDNIVVNPASIAISSRDTVKTDKRDSIKIATQLADGRLSCIYIPSESREDKRNLTRLREQIVNQKNRIANQIKGLLFLYGLIEPHTHPIVSQKWFTKSEGLKMGNSCRFRFEKLTESWLLFNDQLKQTNKEIEKQNEDDQYLLTIYCSAPGIGRTTAYKLINELDDMSQFSNQEKIFRYAGLTPGEYSSGENVRQGHITRQGKPIIRRLLIESSWVAIRKDSSLNDIFKKLSYRTGKKRAIVAIARILLGRIRTCIKEKRLYKISEKTKDAEAA